MLSLSKRIFPLYFTCWERTLGKNGIFQGHFCSVLNEEDAKTWHTNRQTNTWNSLYPEPIPPWIQHWSVQALLAQTPRINRMNPRIKGWVYTLLEGINKLLFIQSYESALKVQNQLLLRGENQDPAVLAAAQTGSKETWKNSRICLRPLAPRGLWGIRRSEGGEKGLETLKPLKFKSCQSSTSPVPSKKIWFISPWLLSEEDFVLQKEKGVLREFRF